MARFTETQLLEAKKLIAPYVRPEHCSSFNAKIPLSVLNCEDKFEQVAEFHNNLLKLVADMFKDFKFDVPNRQRQLVSKSMKPALFIIWLQKEIPHIVDYCMKSFKDDRFELTLITEDNVSNYITIPENIYNYYKEGKICSADYSDYIRVKLLETYEGIYFDATTLFTVKQLPNSVMMLPYWSVKGNYQKNTSPIAMLHYDFGQVYALGGYDNLYYSCVRQMLDKYYSKHEYCFSYYMIYYFFEYFSQLEPCIKEFISYIPIEAEDCEQLAYNLDNLDNAKQFTNTFFYKLRSSDEYTEEHYKFFDKLINN